MAKWSPGAPHLGLALGPAAWGSGPGHATTNYLNTIYHPTPGRDFITPKEPDLPPKRPITPVTFSDGNSDFHKTISLHISKLVIFKSIYVWDNLCHGRQSPILRPNEI